MRYTLSFILVSVLAFTFQVFGDANASSPQGDAGGNSVLPSDFFADALASAKSGDDAMGTQRLVDVKSSELTPSLSLSSSYKYSSNPTKSTSADKLEDGTTFDLSVMMMMGLGEFGIGDDVLSAPSLMLMHMRTYNDPIQDFGHDLRALDMDIQIAGLTIPFVLPNDLTLSVGNSYVRAINFRNNGNAAAHHFKGDVLMYSNTPSVSLSKMIPLENGDILTATAGLSYAISNGDRLSETLKTTTQALLDSGLTDTPADLQTGASYSFNLSYIKPVTDKLSVTPSFSVSKMYYKKGGNIGKVDVTYVAGLSASYPINDWLNLTGAANYTAKDGNRADVIEFRDFTSGFSLAVNHSF
ncbi:MAG: hypothetical protein CMI29_05705 [Opitutae bacterium]|nr:hypothetical protein [Opitutae bacterium]|tara:strand:+ start:1429 stop:2493 length:1065 start_codon:yes stop_codon:yes gene_type:complete